jgi:Na+-transporting NADH:ubiquinone oxidoreductase subunit NqrA
VHIFPHFDLDVLAFTGEPYICLAKFTKKVQRRSSLLTKGQLQGVFPASLPERFLHVIGHPIEAVGRTKTVYALVGTLVVIVSDPVIQPL